MFCINWEGGIVTNLNNCDCVIKGDDVETKKVAMSQIIFEKLLTFNFQSAIICLLLFMGRSTRLLTLNKQWKENLCGPNPSHRC